MSVFNKGNSQRIYLKQKLSRKHKHLLNIKSMKLRTYTEIFTKVKGEETYIQLQESHQWSRPV